MTVCGRLEQRQPEAGKGQIKIAAESRLKYACVMEVMDACLKSGFSNVGFGPRPICSEIAARGLANTAEIQSCRKPS